MITDKFAGIIKAKAATLYVGLGFKPRKLLIKNLTDITSLTFATDFRAGVLAETHYGISRAKAGDEAAITTAAGGVVLYDGGDLMSAASTSYLVRNDKDMRTTDGAGGVQITQFTVGSVANKTGNFNVDTAGSHIGAGSVIILDNGFETYITALTMDGATGGNANEVTLAALPAGAVAGKVYSVSKIRSKWDLSGSAAAVLTPSGFTLGASATVNDTDGDVLYIEAEA